MADKDKIVNLEDLKVVYDNLKAKDDDLNSALSNMGETFPTMPQHFTSGNISVSGGSTTSNKWIRNGAGTTHLFKIQRGDFYIVSDKYAGKVMISDTGALSSAHVIAQATPASGVRSGILAIPDEYEGYYAAIALQKIGYEDADISGDIENIGNYVKYYRPALVNKIPDKTLSVEGYPADAKATGDKFTETDADIKTISDEYLNANVSFTQGGISSSTPGAKTNSNTRIRTWSNNDTGVTSDEYMPVIQKGDFWYVDKQYSAYVVAFKTSEISSASGNVLGVIAESANGIIRIPDTYIGKRCGISLAKIGSESSDISGELTTISQHVQYRRTTDTSLTMSGYPADAKMTGDRLDAGDERDNELQTMMTYQIGVQTLKLASGRILNNGSTSTNASYIRSASNNALLPVVSDNDFYQITSPYKARVALYSKKVLTQSNFIAWLNDEFVSGIITIPSTIEIDDEDVSTVGMYAAINIQRTGYEEANISDDVQPEAPSSTESGHAPYLYVNDYIKYYRPSEPINTDGMRPVYVAFGASTVAGAVHSLDGNGHTVITYTQNNWPNYLGKVLGLETHNLAVGSTGFMKRGDMGYTGYGDPAVKPNICDQILANDVLLTKAGLITIMFGYGNDFNVGVDSSNPQIFQIGHYDDFYDYKYAHDNIANFNTAAGMAYMAAHGATLMGCLNWCIKYLSEKYPYAELAIIYGSPSTNNYDARRVTITGDQPVQKLHFIDGYEVDPDDYNTGSSMEGAGQISRELAKLQKALNLHVVELAYSGHPFNYYRAYAKDPEDESQYALFSTKGDATNEPTYDPFDNDHAIGDPYPSWNSHPNEEGYLQFGRYLAGRVISEFKH